MRAPPTTPPNGISAQHSEVMSELTRPTRCAGIRSKITAPRIGLMKPVEKPPTTATVSTAARGTSSASTTNRGAPTSRNATR